MLKQLARLKWHYIHKRFRTPLYTYLIWDGTCRHYYKAVKFPYELDNFIYLDTQIAIALPDWEGLRQRVNRRLKRDPLILKKLLQDSYKLNQKVEKFCQQLEKVNYGKVSDRQMLTYWQEYLRLTSYFGAYVLLPIVIESDMEQQLKVAIEKQYGSAKAEEIFQVMTTPIKPGATQLEEVALLKLAVAYAKGINISPRLDKHVRQHGWIINNSFTGRFMTKAELLRRVKAVAKKNPVAALIAYRKKTADLQRQFNRYRAVLAKDRKLAALIDTLQKSIYFRSWRTERYYRNAQFLQPFFKHTAQLLRLRMTTDLFYFLPPEIPQLLASKSKADAKVVTQRKKGICLFPEPKGVNYFPELT